MKDARRMGAVREGLLEVVGTESGKQEDHRVVRVEDQVVGVEVENQVANPENVWKPVAVREDQSQEDDNGDGEAAASR